MKRQVVEYSPAEKRLLKLLPRGGSAVSTDILVERFFRGKYRNFHAGSTVRATLSSLIRKVEHNEEPFRIVKGPRRGPYPSEVRIEKR